MKKTMKTVEMMMMGDITLSLSPSSSHTLEQLSTVWKSNGYFKAVFTAPKKPITTTMMNA